MAKAIILAGGKGERFWPKSQDEKPKQFLNLLNSKRTMIQETFHRLRHIFKPKDIYVITNKTFFQMTKQQLKDIDEKNIIIEPLSKNTAPCIGYTIITLMKKKDEIFLFIPSDHYISNTETFLRQVKYACRISRNQNKIITFGIKPNRTETGYGYIKIERRIETFKTFNVFNIEGFKEKPNISTAIEYLKSSEYYWNSGLFITPGLLMLERIKKHLPKLYKVLKNISKNPDDQKFNLNEFKKAPSISIDYGVMEKTRSTLMIEAKFEWDDVGSWSALDRIFKKDKNKNIIFGSPVVKNVRSSIIDVKNVNAVISGVDNLIVVSDGKNLLILNKDLSQELKDLLKKMKK